MDNWGENPMNNAISHRRPTKIGTATFHKIEESAFKTFRVSFQFSRLAKLISIKKKRSTI